MNVSAQAGRELALRSAFSLYLGPRLAHGHSHWGGPSALFFSSVQMLISSRNNLTDTSRNNILQLSGLLLTQSS